MATSYPPTIANEEIPIVGQTSGDVIRAALGRYRFASRFVRDKTVLDVGCAGGHGTLALASAGSAKVVGVDLSVGALLHARQHAQHPNVHYLCGNMLEAPLRASFDVVLAFEVVEHTENPRVFLQSLADLLSDDGVCILSTPNAAKRKTTRYRNPYHRFEWTVEELRDNLTSIFGDVQLYGQGTVGPRLARRMRSWCIGIEGSDLRHRLPRRLLHEISQVLGYAEDRGEDVTPLSHYSSQIPIVTLAVCRQRRMVETSG